MGAGINSNDLAPCPWCRRKAYLHGVCGDDGRVLWSVKCTTDACRVQPALRRPAETKTGAKLLWNDCAPNMVLTNSGPTA
jgi:hypothetical protein